MGEWEDDTKGTLKLKINKRTTHFHNQMIFQNNVSKSELYFRSHCYTVDY